MTPSRNARDRDWTEGRPVLGLHLRGVGLTRHALRPLWWAAVPWIVGLVLLVQLLALPPGAPVGGGDRSTPIPPPFTALPTAFAFVVGIIMGLVALTTYRSRGRPMTTRRRAHRPAGTG